ncbi:MAG: guanylate kinase [Pseudomonadota bacterium]
MKRNAMLLALSSPSGAGKSTMARRLMADDPGFRMSVSATTRPPRPGEREGHDYFFYSEEAFRRDIAEGGFLEHAEVFGNLYGTPRAPIEEMMETGSDVLLDVDWQGAQQLRASPLGRSSVLIFILPPSIAALEARLKARGQDDPNVISGRMDKAMAEIIHWAEYDYVLINDDMDACYSQIRTIVNSERLRRDRRPGLRGFVSGLDSEFRDRKATQ